MTTRLAMDTGNFSYLCLDIFWAYFESHKGRNACIVTDESFEICSKTSASTTQKI